MKEENENEGEEFGGGSNHFRIGGLLFVASDAYNICNKCFNNLECYTNKTHSNKL